MNRVRSSRLLITLLMGIFQTLSWAKMEPIGKDTPFIHIVAGTDLRVVPLKPGVDIPLPVEFGLTDPLGRYTGFDPTAQPDPNDDGRRREEIPNSSYIIELGIGDDSEEAEADPSRAINLPDSRVMYVTHPVAGTYTLEIIGLVEAIYGGGLRLIRNDSDRSLTGLTGFTRSGLKQSFQIQYSPIPGDPVGVRKIVTFASLTEEIKIARRLGLIKNQGIQTSLLAKLASAQQAKDRNQPKTAGNVLNALLKEISAQKDKGIDKTAAAIFTESVQALLSEIRQ